MLEVRPFDNIIKHLERKKPKKGCVDGENHIVNKPVYHTETIGQKQFLYIDYNYYYVCIVYDDEKVFNPYKISIEKPCVITRGGGQDLGTAFYDAVWHSEEDVWLDLQQHWKKTIL